MNTAKLSTFISNFIFIFPFTLSILLSPQQIYACKEKVKPLKISGSSFEPFTSISYTTQDRVTLKIDTTAENGDVYNYQIYKNSDNETCLHAIKNLESDAEKSNESEKCGKSLKNLSIKLDPKHKLTGYLVFEKSMNVFSIFSSKNGKSRKDLPYLKFEIDEENSKKWAVSAFDKNKQIGEGSLFATKINRTQNDGKRKKRVVDIQNLDGDLRGFKLQLKTGDCDSKAIYSAFEDSEK